MPPPHFTNYFSNLRRPWRCGLFGCATWLDSRADDHWQRSARTIRRGACRAAGTSVIGWLLLTSGYVTALLLVANQARAGLASAGDIVLVSQLALQLRGNVIEAAGRQLYRDGDGEPSIDSSAGGRRRRRTRRQYCGTSPAPDFSDRRHPPGARVVHLPRNQQRGAPRTFVCTFRPARPSP